MDKKDKVEDEERIRSLSEFVLQDGFQIPAKRTEIIVERATSILFPLKDSIPVIQPNGKTRCMGYVCIMCLEMQRKNCLLSKNNLSKHIKYHLRNLGQGDSMDITRVTELIGCRVIFPKKAQMDAAEAKSSSPSAAGAAAAGGGGDAAAAGAGASSTTSSSSSSISNSNGRLIAPDVNGGLSKKGKFDSFDVPDTPEDIRKWLVEKDLAEIAERFILEGFERAKDLRGLRTCTVQEIRDALSIEKGVLAIRLKEALEELF